MSGSGGIQTSVNTLPTPGIPGDWCDSNPRYSVDAGPFGLIAGANGLTIGRFAWLDYSLLDSNGFPARANNFGVGLPAGLFHREMQAQIVTYLADASNLVQAGYPITLHSQCGMWVKNDGTTEAQVGQKAFAVLATGQVVFAPAGTVYGGAEATASSIAASTFSVTGSIAPSGGGGQNQASILTVTVVGSGTIYPGAAISGTGIPTSPAPQIAAQILPLAAGEALGGVGRYALNVGEITAASETISGTYGTLTIGTLVGAGTFSVGMLLSGGTGVVANTSITANISGTGGAGGTMVVNNNTVVSSTTIFGSTAIETTFVARSSALPGESVKISNQQVP